MRKKIKEGLKLFVEAICASLILFGIGAIAVLFGLGAAGLAYLQGDVETAIRMINDWLVPMWLGGTLGSLFGISLTERMRRKKETLINEAD